MTPAQVAAGFGALLLTVGIWLVGAYVTRWEPPTPSPRLQRGGDRVLLSRALVAAVVGVACWTVTGWPVLGLGAAAGALGLPAILREPAVAARQIARVEAVEEWTRRLADVIGIGVGLEQAIQTAARTAPTPIESEVRSLAARISARLPTEEALRRFADDLADPAADLVVGALILAARRRGPGAAAALTAIAESVAEEVAARRRVEADRARPRTTARAVTVITLLIIGMGALNRDYTHPYATPLGQVALGAVLALFGASLWWMHSMTRSVPAPRILAPAEARS